LLAAVFFGGALFTGLVIISFDIFLIGYPSTHSKSALFELETAAVLFTALVGAVIYTTGLAVQKFRISSHAKRPINVSIACGFLYSLLLGLAGPGVLLRVEKHSLDDSWTPFLYLLIPFGLSFVMRLWAK
jgi:hypothetical protein